MKTLALVLASQGILFAASAYANPYATELARIREVPGPHVQLTYAVEMSKTPQTPSVPVGFGSRLTPWKTATSYQANSGSGVRPLNAIQMCDCNVPLGQNLVYKLSAVRPYDGKSVEYTLTVTPTGTGVYDASVIDATSGAGDAGPTVMPWDIPDPVEIQGLDCTAECNAPQPLDAGAGPVDAQSPGTGGTGGTVVVDAALTADVALGAAGASGSGGALGVGGMLGTGGKPVSPGTGGAVGAGGSSASTTSPKKSDDGGCSMASGDHSTGLLLLALVGLALVGRRKRRA
jgi:MYXO-CTERM domain-containing protein